MMDLIVEKTIKVNYVIDNTPAESKKLLSVSIPTSKPRNCENCMLLSLFCMPVDFSALLWTQWKFCLLQLLVTQKLLQACPNTVFHFCVQLYRLTMMGRDRRHICRHNGDFSYWFARWVDGSWYSSGVWKYPALGKGWWWYLLIHVPYKIKVQGEIAFWCC